MLCSRVYCSGIAKKNQYEECREVLLVPGIWWTTVPRGTSIESHVHVSYRSWDCRPLPKLQNKLQLTAVLPSFVNTTQELGGHHEPIQTCHQIIGGMFISPSHMHGNRRIRHQNVDNLAQSNPRGVRSCCRSCD